MKIIATALLLILGLCAGSIAQSALCPDGMVCISPAAARQALIDSDTVKAQQTEIAAKDQAILDLKAELANMRLQYAEKVGENTALKQNAVSDRAIITAMIPMLRQKVVGVKIF